MRRRTAEQQGHTTGCDHVLRAGSDRYDSILCALLEDCGASRVTLRLDPGDRTFPIVSEALSKGVGSIKDDNSFDLTKAASSRYVLETRKILVQSDCASGPHRPPAGFMERYGVRAQILFPVVIDDVALGIVSVHHVAPRPWGRYEQDQGRQAVSDVIGILSSGNTRDTPPR